MDFDVKARLLTTTILGGLLVCSAPVYAQTADDVDAPVQTTSETTADEAEVEADEVVVTGSRLRRSEFTSASPLQVIDGEIARDLGLVDAADILGQTTVVQGQQTTTGLSTSAGVLTDSGPGSATASLRGLNPGRTLVLVNGRRLAPAGVRGVPSAPDINLIPGTLVQRVDVLLDGASSVYGSDAVAGVVNYILRTDFDGLQLDAFATLPELRGNAGRQQVYTATFGTSNERGFIGAAIEHSRTDGYNAGAFGDFYEPYAGDCISTYAQGVSGTVYDNCSGSFGAGSAISPVGFVGFEQGRNEPGLPSGFFRIPVTADLLTSGSANGAALLLWPEELNRAFAPDFHRTSMFTVGEYNTGLYGDLTAYFEASHAFRVTDTNTSGQGVVELPTSYVFNDFGGPTTLFFNNRFINETEVSQSRIIGGVRGELPFMNNFGMDNWNWDAYVSYSRSTGNDSVEGIPFSPRLQQTLENTRIDPTLGPVCDPRLIPNEPAGTVNCLPLDFLDPTFILTGRFADPAANEYLFPNRLTATTVEQTVVSAYVSGDLFEIPTGGMIVAGFGGEYRDDAIVTKTSLAGEFLSFFDDPGSNGTRQLNEVFGEVELPLLLDKPFAEVLSLNLAARYTDETNFGSETTYSAKALYQPVDWLTFRATVGTSFRAPNLGEQFGGRVTGFGNPNDPCRTPGVAVPFDDYDNDPSTPDTREYVPSLDPRSPDVIANCQNGGGPFNIEATDPFSLGIRGLGGTSPVFLGAPTLVASGSNPNLDAETSEAKSFGVVLEQPWSDDFDLRVAVTYFEIIIDDEVDSLTASTIVNRCYNSPGLTDPTCAFLTRDPRVAGDENSGEISFVSALNQNLGQQVVEGIDYNAELAFDFTTPFSASPVDYGLTLRATQSTTQTEEQFVVEGIVIDDDLREFGNPEWRVTLTNSFQWEDFTFLFQSRYISDMIEDNADPEDPVTSGFNSCVQAGDTFEPGFFTETSRPACRSFDNLDEYWVHNASLAWRQDDLVVRVGVNNVFNDAPPLTNNNNLGSLAGIGYDIGGRTFFGNVTKKF